MLGYQEGLEKKVEVLIIRVAKEVERQEEKTAVAKPFLKWAGGKRQLLPLLLNKMPSSFKRYHEPFLGGGALFFALKPKHAFLSDINDELVGAYQILKDKPGDLITELKKHKYDKDYYYELRETDRSPEYKSWSKLKRAARLIYLNKSCYNGLYRVNAKGQFNTPFGDYKNPTIFTEENLIACSEALQRAKLSEAPFDLVLTQAKKGDFVYLDPPYMPLSSTSNFTSYSKESFGEAEQRKLFDTCVKLDKRGVYFMLSNSAAPFICELYEPFKVELVNAKRAINSKGSSRGAVKEVIVRNYA